MTAAPAASSLAHMVYFTLKDPSSAAEKKLVDDCHRFLKGISGIDYFAVGTRVGDLARPVNMQDFHVGLHLVFESRKAHDDYQVDARHQQFVAENKETWQQVRIFDCSIV